MLTFQNIQELSTASLPLDSLVAVREPLKITFTVKASGVGVTLNNGNMAIPDLANIEMGLGRKVSLPIVGNYLKNYTLTDGVWTEDAGGIPTLVLWDTLYIYRGGSDLITSVAEDPLVVNGDSALLAKSTGISAVSSEELFLSEDAISILTPAAIARITRMTMGSVYASPEFTRSDEGDPNPNVSKITPPIGEVFLTVRSGDSYATISGTSNGVGITDPVVSTHRMSLLVDEYGIFVESTDITLHDASHLTGWHVTTMVSGRAVEPTGSTLLSDVPLPTGSYESEKRSLYHMYRGYMNEASMLPGVSAAARWDNGVVESVLITKPVGPNVLQTMLTHGTKSTRLYPLNTEWTTEDTDGLSSWLSQATLDTISGNETEFAKAVRDYEKPVDKASSVSGSVSDLEYEVRTAMYHMNTAISKYTQYSHNSYTTNFTAAVSKDGSKVVTSDRIVHVGDITGSFRPIETLPGVASMTHLAMDATGDVILDVDDYYNEYRVYQSAGVHYQPPYQLVINGGLDASDVAMSGNGRIMASINDQHDLRLFPTTSRILSPTYRGVYTFKGDMGADLTVNDWTYEIDSSYLRPNSLGYSGDRIGYGDVLKIVSWRSLSTINVGLHSTPLGVINEAARDISVSDSTLWAYSTLTNEVVVMDGLTELYRMEVTGWALADTDQLGHTIQLLDNGSVIADIIRGGVSTYVVYLNRYNTTFRLASNHSFREGTPTFGASSNGKTLAYATSDSSYTIRSNPYGLDPSGV